MPIGFTSEENMRRLLEMEANQRLRREETRDARKRRREPRLGPSPGIANTVGAGNGNCGCAFIAAGSITDPGGVTGNFANRYTIVGGVSSEFGTDDIDMDYDTGANWLSGAITFTC